MGGQAAAAAPAQPQQFHSPPRGALLTAPPSPPPSRAPAPAAASAAAAASVSATAGYGAGAAPRPAAPRVKLYRNEEVILFRTPTDASHLVLFNLPSKPFLHPFYDLKTVAKARHEANEALCKEKAATAGATAVGANTGTGVPGSVAPAAAASSVSTAPAVTIRPPTFQPRPFGAAPAPPTAAQLCATYHALHLQNVERVLHHLSRKYGLVHELSLQCKPRDSGGDGGLSRYKRRRSLYPLGGFEDDEDDSDPAYAAIASFEAGFNLWAYLKYYSVLHAAHAAKELNRTELIKGQRIKAKRIQRNTPHTQSPVKPAQANTTAGAAVAAASASSTTSPIKSVPSVSPRVSYPLGHHRCLDLCNYFLGFNSWNCAIQQMRKYNHQSDEDIMDGQWPEAGEADESAETTSQETDVPSPSVRMCRRSTCESHVLRVRERELCKLVSVGRSAGTTRGADDFACRSHCSAFIASVCACSVGLRRC